MVARDLRTPHVRTAPIRPDGGWLLPPLITARIIPALLSAAVALAASWLWLLATPGFESAVAEAAAQNPAPELRVSLPPGGISSVFTPEVQRWSPQITRWAAEAGVSPDLAATVMQIESCGGASARSSAGASGLFQVMPFHFADGEDMLQVDTNARRGLAYLARAYALAGGDLSRTLAGYNGGHGVIARDPSTWSAETRRYVYWGTGILEDIQAGFPASPRLDEWLNAGGAALCRKAASDVEPR
jgi:soluble lytic murein transglycosylase-like protein